MMGDPIVQAERKSEEVARERRRMGERKGWTCSEHIKVMTTPPENGLSVM